MNVVTKSLMATIALLALAGCKSKAETNEEAHMQFHQKCVGYGYADYTEAYKSCMKSFMDDYEKNLKIQKNSHSHLR